MPFVFWHYIFVDEVSLITLKKLLQSQEPAPDKVRRNYYKLRQVSLLQSAMDSDYKLRHGLLQIDLFTDTAAILN